MARNFDRRVRGLGIRQVRTPFRSPRANAVAERWVRSARSECLDHLIVFNGANLRRVLSVYVTYYNCWRPHRSLGQAFPCGQARSSPGKHAQRSPPNLCSVGYTTFTALLHDKFCAPQPSAPNAGSASHAYPMVCVRGRFGGCTPGRSHHTLSVWRSQFYMMRLDITPLISHQSKMLTDFARPKIWIRNLMKRRTCRKTPDIVRPVPSGR